MQRGSESEKTSFLLSGDLFHQHLFRGKQKKYEWSAWIAGGRFEIESCWDDFKPPDSSGAKKNNINAYVGVSLNSGNPQIIHFNRVFH